MFSRDISLDVPISKIISSNKIDCDKNTSTIDDCCCHRLKLYKKKPKCSKFG